jgi:hypothetical protein
MHAAERTSFRVEGDVALGDIRSELVLEKLVHAKGSGEPPPVVRQRFYVNDIGTQQ